MADTTSISPKPGIKCYVGDNKLCNRQSYNTANTTLEKIRNLTDADWLWTKESAYCTCTHHVIYHCTIYDKYGLVVAIHCHGNNERCSCEHFRTQRLRIASEEEVI
jgi:hypothetical protein